MKFSFLRLSRHSISIAFRALQYYVPQIANCNCHRKIASYANASERYDRWFDLPDFLLYAILDGILFKNVKELYTDWGKQKFASSQPH